MLVTEGVTGTEKYIIGRCPATIVRRAERKRGGGNPGRSVKKLYRSYPMAPPTEAERIGWWKWDPTKPLSKYFGVDERLVPMTPERFLELASGGMDVAEDVDYWKDSDFYRHVCARMREGMVLDPPELWVRWDDPRWESPKRE